MGNFVDAPTRSRTELPVDLPNPVDAVRDGRPSGSAFRSDDGQLYRLVWPTWRLDARAKPSDATVNGKPVAVAAPAQVKR